MLPVPQLPDLSLLTRDDLCFGPESRVVLTEDNQSFKLKNFNITCCGLGRKNSSENQRAWEAFGAALEHRIGVSLDEAAIEAKIEVIKNRDLTLTDYSGLIFAANQRQQRRSREETEGKPEPPIPAVYLPPGHLNLFVVGQDGIKVPFDRDQVVRHLREEPGYSYLTEGMLEEIIQRVEAHLRPREWSVVSKEEIRDLVNRVLTDERGL